MINLLTSKKGQAVYGEYVLVFFIVVGAISVMTVYFKRAVQARIYDARNYMVNDIIDRIDYHYDTGLTWEYETYTKDTTATVNSKSNNTSTLEQSPGVSSGIFQMDIDEKTVVEMRSETAPPGQAN